MLQLPAMLQVLFVSDLELKTGIRNLSCCYAGYTNCKIEDCTEINPPLRSTSLCLLDQSIVSRLLSQPPTEMLETRIRLLQHRLL